MNLPNELINHILSFCEGHIRADLRVKQISVKLKNNILIIDDKLCLHQYFTYGDSGENVFINKKNTDLLIGYVSKNIIANETIIYTWIKIFR